MWTRLRRLPLASWLALLCAACAFLLPHGAPDIEGWKREASELRGLEFLEEVRIRWISAEDIPKLTRAEITAKLSDDYVQAYRDAYVALGLLPAGIDLLDTLLDLHREQLGGLYSIHDRTMYIVAGLGPPAPQKPQRSGRSEWRRRRGAGEPTHPSVPGEIVVHEMVHALQHQHFPQTLHLLDEVRFSDDVGAAVAAAVEGDASLQALGSESMPGFGRDVESAQLMRDSMLAELVSPHGVLAEVPRILQVSLIYPYAHGVMMAAERYQEGGNAALDELLRSPPLSMVRVRYPQDTDPVEFIALPAEPIEASGCEVGHQNVAGILAIGVLMLDHAAGDDLDELLPYWSGDRFQHLTCRGVSELIWFTRWNDAAAAERFARRYRRIAPSVAERAGLTGAPTVRVSGRNALVLTPGVEQLREPLIEGAEIRSYQTFEDWFADGCFPESPCPGTASLAEGSRLLDGRSLP